MTSCAEQLSVHVRRVLAHSLHSKVGLDEDQVHPLSFGYTRDSVQRVLQEHKIFQDNALLSIAQFAVYSALERHGPKMKNWFQAKCESLNHELPPYLIINEEDIVKAVDGVQHQRAAPDDPGIVIFVDKLARCVRPLPPAAYNVRQPPESDIARWNSLHSMNANGESGFYSGNEIRPPSKAEDFRQKLIKHSYNLFDSSFRQEPRGVLKRINVQEATVLDVLNQLRQSGGMQIDNIVSCTKKTGHLALKDYCSRLQCWMYNVIRSSLLDPLHPDVNNFPEFLVENRHLRAMAGMVCDEEQDEFVEATAACAAPVFQEVASRSKCPVCLELKPTLCQCVEGRHVAYCDHCYIGTLATTRGYSDDPTAREFSCSVCRRAPAFHVTHFNATTLNLLSFLDFLFN